MHWINNDINGDRQENKTWMFVQELVHIPFNVTAPSSSRKGMQEDFVTLNTVAVDEVGTNGPAADKLIPYTNLPIHKSKPDASAEMRLMDPARRTTYLHNAIVTNKHVQSQNPDQVLQHLQW